MRFIVSLLILIVTVGSICIILQNENIKREKDNEKKRYELVSEKLDEAKGSLYIEAYKDEDKSYKVWTNRGTYIIKFNDEYTKINQAVKIGNETKKSKADNNK